MPLDLDQLRALAQLKRAHTSLREAAKALEEAEAGCWRAGISHRQVAVITGESHSSISRRLSRIAKGGR